MSKSASLTRFGLTRVLSKRRAYAVAGRDQPPECTRSLRRPGSSSRDRAAPSPAARTFTPASRRRARGPAHSDEAGLLRDS
jgi:hypothetical protein